METLCHRLTCNRLYASFHTVDATFVIEPDDDDVLSRVLIRIMRLVQQFPSLSARRASVSKENEKFNLT